LVIAGVPRRDAGKRDRWNCHRLGTTHTGSRALAPPRGFDGGDVDLLHRHNRFERTLRLRAPAPGSASPEITGRLEALERSVEVVQQELAETQERLDFAERLLSQAREDRRIGG
jgi:hypothetical protein